MRVTGKTNRQRAASFRVGDGSQRVRRSPAGRNTNHHVSLRDTQPCHICAPSLRAILQVLVRLAQRLRTASNASHHHLLRNVKGLGAFGGI